MDDQVLSDALAFLEVIENNLTLSSRDEDMGRQAHHLCQRLRARGIEPTVPWPPHVSEAEAIEALDAVFG